MIKKWSDLRSHFWWSCNSVKLTTRKTLASSCNCTILTSSYSIFLMLLPNVHITQYILYCLPHEIKKPQLILMILLEISCLHIVTNFVTLHLWIRIEGTSISNSFYVYHSGPENLKKTRPKNSWNQIRKSIWRNFILTKFHFLQFQKWPKINFWTRKMF